VEYIDSMQEVAVGCDSVVIATEWPQFAEIDWKSARHVMHTPILFDGRNLLDRAEMEMLGFLYKGVGR
jgi:UDPglucose 6-dehydrogenase